MTVEEKILLGKCAWQLPNVKPKQTSLVSIVLSHSTRNNPTLMINAPTSDAELGCRTSLFPLGHVRWVQGLGFMIRLCGLLTPHDYVLDMFLRCGEMLESHDLASGFLDPEPKTSKPQPETFTPKSKPLNPQKQEPNPKPL